MKRSPKKNIRVTLWNFFRARLKSLSRSTSASVDHLIVRQLTSSRRPTRRQLSYFFKVLTPKERQRFLGLTLIMLISGALIFRQLWHWTFVRIPAVGGSYTEALVGAPQHLNPLYAVSNDVDRDLVRLLFSGLVRFNAQGEAEPDLAESIATSPDGTSYTITLRQGLTWSDGGRVTSDDVRFTIEAAKNPAYRSPLKSQFNSVTVETVDEYTVQLNLATSSAPFIENLTLGLLPAHLWASVDPKNALITELNRKPVSVGPYRFDALAKDPNGNVRSYTLIRRAEGVPHTPSIEKLVFKFYPDFHEAANALKNHNAEGLALVPVESLEQALKARKDLVHYRLPLPEYTAIFFNAQMNDALAQPKVRQALTRAVDREKIVREVLHSEGIVIDGPFLPGSLGYDVHASTTPFELNIARALLDEAGWILPEGESIRVKKDSTQTLTLTLTTVGRPEQFHAAELVQKQWQALGVKVDLQVVDPAQVFELIRPRAYQALLVSEITGVDPDPYPFWHSSALGEQGLNLANFSNRDADRLLEEARRATDPAVREENYRTFQAILSRDLPAIFLYASTPAYAIERKVKGVHLAGLSNPSDRFAYTDQWYIQTDWRLR